MPSDRPAHADRVPHAVRARAEAVPSAWAANLAPPAGGLGYLLYKHPDKLQSFDLSFGRAHVYYPEVGARRCTACLILDVDADGLVRDRNPDQDFLLAEYVNDRPCVASSFLRVAVAQVFGSALQGRCKDSPELVATPIPLEARLDVLPVRGGQGVL